MATERLTEHSEDDAKALTVLRRGLGVSPELRVGVAVTVAMALTMAIGRLAVPILVQQIIDRGISGDQGFRPGFVYGACAIAAMVVIAVMLLARVTYLRLVRNAEATLLGLRTRVFAHIHRLSLADHNEIRKGVLTARVTSDIESLAQFMQWGAIAWVVNGAIIIGTMIAIAIYAWPLMLLVLAVYLPLVPLLRRI
jgi:putative ABC transport system ATP-binding protein